MSAKAAPCTMPEMRLNAFPPLAGALIGAYCFFTATLAVAHHSAATFDLETTVPIEGTVSSYEWRNPHVYLTVDSADGTTWLLETDSIAIMTRSGWTRDTFAPGDLVTARFNPDRDATKAHGLMLSIQDAAGDQYVSINRFRDSVDYSADTRADSLAGVWQGNTSLTAEFMRRLNSHPLTEAGNAALEAYNERMYPTAQCIPWPTPFFFAGLYLKEIELQEDQVVIRSELFSAERRINLGMREHPANVERSTQGHSIGWWEGDTLVVDTRFFSDHRSPVGHTGIPSGGQRHVVERLTLNEDGRSISIEILLEDPQYLEQPLAAELALHYSPHLEMLDVECDPEVATRYLRSENQ